MFMAAIDVWSSSRRMFIEVYRAAFLKYIHQIMMSLRELIRFTSTDKSYLVMINYALSGKHFDICQTCLCDEPSHSEKVSVFEKI